MSNPVNWFEIATTDLERAKEFYTVVFKRDFQLIEIPGSKMYIFYGARRCYRRCWRVDVF
ncbi:MAG: putative enzyme related to lactoylglutathione lyase [Flavobacteriaceae bacterium]|jgi:predicted enzyme related to lactoylglutathione lyase